jgi:ribosomal protein S18 acetylase RimI-like enzyme
MRIRPLEDRDRPWAARLVAEYFASTRVVTHGVMHETGLLPGFVAVDGRTPVGLVLCDVTEGQAEVLALIAVRRREGIGTALLRALRRHAEALGLRRLWLITTNNNRESQAFYEAISMRQCAVYPNAVAEARTLKPELPKHDEHGVAIRDEIEYEWVLGGEPSAAGRAASANARPD